MAREHCETCGQVATVRAGGRLICTVHISHDEYMRAVDYSCYWKAGLSVYDLSDQPFADWQGGGRPSTSGRAAGVGARGIREAKQ